MGIIGDINNDGKLDRSDLDALKAIIKECGGNTEALNQLPPELLDKLDVNGDGQLDEDDIEALCNQIFSGKLASASQLAGKLSALRGKF